ncbi:MAG: hypothetical protein KKE96_08285 [Candidatus Altiarchaeota archaeon]|nr:hypothetical protein [Candidatus Altiarchaeota archaeon]MBU4406134.1 hypothetical protein [Candidatus Altiarchaeota archaeon]
MMKRLRRVRKSAITREELIADAIFLFISAFISFTIVFLFDIHRSFYSWPIFPLRFIFKTYQPYVLFTLIGTILLFFIIKLLIFGIKEEESR